jgi:hypothetical protein
MGERKYPYLGDRVSRTDFNASESVPALFTGN